MDLRIKVERGLPMQPKFSRRIVQKKAPVWSRKQTTVCCPDCNQGYLIVEQRQKPKELEWFTLCPFCEKRSSTFIKSGNLG